MAETKESSPALLTDAIARGRLALAEIAAILEQELEAMFELAAQCLDAGRDAQAVDVLAGLVVLFPYSARYWRAYGVALHRRLALTRARAAYDAALAFEPGHLLTRCYRAEVDLYLGEQQQAQKELEELARAPDVMIAGRARELLTQIDVLAAWEAPEPEPEEEPEGGPDADRPLFTLDDDRTLPLQPSAFTPAAPTSRIDEGTTQRARIFAPFEEAHQAIRREPTVTQTAVVYRRKQKAERNSVPGDSERTLTAVVMRRARTPLCTNDEPE